jgi:hypothetical protein
LVFTVFVVFLIPRTALHCTDLRVNRIAILVFLVSAESPCGLQLLKLLKCIHKSNILAEEQFGFRTQISTDTSIYKLSNEILKILNSKNLIGGIFCNLETAFDSGVLWCKR